MEISFICFLAVGLIGYANYRWYKAIFNKHERQSDANIQNAVDSKVFTLDEAEKEENVRLNWLYAFFWLIVSNYVFAIASALLAITYSEKLSSSSIATLLPGFILIEFLKVGIFSFIGFFLSYHFGYKKRGTKWLLLNVIGFALSFGLIIVALVFGAGALLIKYIPFQPLVIPMAIGLMFQCLTTYKLLIQTYKLRKFNLHRKNFFKKVELKA